MNEIIYENLMDKLSFKFDNKITGFQTITLQDCLNTGFLIDNEESILLKSGIRSYIYINAIKLILEYTKEISKWIMTILKDYDHNKLILITPSKAVLPILGFIHSLFPCIKVIYIENEDSYKDLFSLQYKNYKIVIIEDVLTTGNTVLELYKKINPYILVAQVISIVDRSTHHNICLPDEFKYIYSCYIDLQEVIDYRKQQKKDENNE